MTYSVSEYGDLGYDPAQGAPKPNKPVQDQYRGTWAMYTPPSDDPRVGKLLAKHVLNAAMNPMVYMTNGEVEGIGAGESVTFKAHVIGGKPEYTYKWFIKKEGNSWLSAGENSPTLTWAPKNKKGGSYSIRCKVRDAQKHSGEIT